MKMRRIYPAIYTISIYRLAKNANFPVSGLFSDVFLQRMLPFAM
jgi:hypothetical protein